MKRMNDRMQIVKTSRQTHDSLRLQTSLPSESFASSSLLRASLLILYLAAGTHGYEHRSSARARRRRIESLSRTSFLHDSSLSDLFSFCYPRNPLACFPSAIHLDLFEKVSSATVPEEWSSRCSTSLSQRNARKTELVIQSVTSASLLRQLDFSKQSVPTSPGLCLGLTVRKRPRKPTDQRERLSLLRRSTHNPLLRGDLCAKLFRAFSTAVDHTARQKWLARHVRARTLLHQTSNLPRPSRSHSC